MEHKKIEKIKGCPFCGELPDMSHRASEYTTTEQIWFLRCCCGGYSACAWKSGSTEEEVIERWNTRK